MQVLVLALYTSAFCLLSLNIAQGLETDESEWEEIVSRLEEKVDTSGEGPNSLHSVNDSSVRFPSKHDPFLKFTTDRVVIDIGVRGADGSSSLDSLHPMNENHFIEVIYVKDQNGKVVHLQRWTAEEAELSYVRAHSKIVYTRFKYRDGTTHLTPYSYCNLHGLWIGPTYDVNWEKEVAYIEGVTKKNAYVQKLRFNPFKDHKENVMHVPSTTFEKQRGEEMTESKLLGITTVRGLSGSLQMLHPMNENHSIEVVYAKDQHNRTISLEGMKPETHRNPVSKYEIPEGTQTIQAYTYCRNHGLWQGKVHLIEEEREKCAVV